jgi:hypothetical protein
MSSSEVIKQNMVTAENDPNVPDPEFSELSEQDLKRRRATERMRVTKFKKKLEETRKQIEDCAEAEGPTLSKLLNKEHTLEEQIDYCTALIEAMTVVYDSKRRTRALLTGKAMSESALSESPQPVSSSTEKDLSSLRKQVDVGTPLPPVPEEAEVQPPCPKVAAQTEAENFIDHLSDVDDAAFRSVVSEALRFTPQPPRLGELPASTPVVDSVNRVSLLSPQEFGKFGTISTLCEGDFDLPFHIEMFESWLVNIRAASCEGGVVKVPDSIKTMVVDSFIKSLGTNTKLVSSTRELAKCNKFDWYGVAKGLKQRFCDTSTLVQSYETARSKLKLKDAESCEDYVSKARLLFTSFSSVWGDDGAERRNLIKILVQQLDPRIRAGVCEKLVEQSTSLDSRTMWYDCSFDNYLLAVKRTCLTLGATKEMDRVNSIGEKKRGGWTGTTPSLTEWVNDHLSKGRAVKVLLRCSEADMKTIKDSSGFVGMKEGKSRASGKVYYTVAFASSATAERALESAKIEGRNWSPQTKGVGHRA